MRKQLAMGAGIALAFGAVAIGCSSSSKSSGGTFVPSSVDLNNGDNAPMSAIATNNLSADGAGFSASQQNFVALQCKINAQPNGSDNNGTQKASTADGSALVAFQTADQLDGHYRLYMSYFDGSAFTPPVEVTGVDRDEYANAGGATPDITTQNILMIPLNTSGYKGGSSTNSTDAASVRSNAGNWVVVWDATTFSTVPNSQGSLTATNANSQAGLLGQSVNGNLVSGNTVNAANANQRIQQNLKGAHRALYETLFVKSLKSTPSSFSQVLGTNGSTTTSTQPSREYRYGFLVNAPQITVLQRGAEVGLSSAQLTSGNAPSATAKFDILSPAESVGSYGFASDGLASCAQYSGTTTGFSVSGAGFANAQLSAGVSPNSVTGVKSFERVEQPHALVNQSGGTAGKLIEATPAQGAPSGAAYTVGEDVSFVQLFWTQIVSSANSQSFVVSNSSVDVGHAGSRLAAFRAGLDLRTMTFDAAPTEITVASTEPTQPLKSSVSPIAGFSTYNQFVFMNFVDASLATFASNGAGTESSNGFEVREFNTALVAFTITDNGNGTSAVGAATRLSVQPTSTLKTDNLDVINSGGSRSGEFFGNQDQAWLAGSGCCIFGSDQGLGDTTVFFVEQHSSLVTGDQNVDLELAAAVLKSDGTLQTAAAGKNPILLSQSVGEPAGDINDNIASNPLQQFGRETGNSFNASPVSGFVLHDPVQDVNCCINRDGTYVVVTYNQFEGQSSGAFNRALNAVVMKTFRPVSSGTGSSTAPSVETRFAAGSSSTSSAPGSQGANNEIRIDDTSTSGVTLTQPNIQGSYQSITASQTSTTQGGINSENFPYVVNNAFLNSTVVDTNLNAFPSRTNVNGGQVIPCGYRCSFQSDRSKVNVVWEQSDTSEDRVFVRQLKVDTTAATPVVTLGTIGELETGNLVTGDVVNNANTGIVQSTFRFVQGDVDRSGLTAVDLGVDSSKAGGGLLFVYAKTTDATTTDGTFFSRSIVAAQWDGSTVSNRTVIDRGVFENTQRTQAVFPAGLPAAFGPSGVNGPPFALGPQNVPAVSTTTFGGAQSALKTQLLSVVQVSPNPDIKTAPSLSPTGTYIYFTTPNGDNADSPAGLYTRKYDNSLRAATGTSATTFNNQFVPPAPAAGGSFDAAHQPSRLDHTTGGDVLGLVGSPLQTGATAFVLFLQDGHIWGTGTTDGITYTNDGSASVPLTTSGTTATTQARFNPDPFLIDNDTSASAQYQNVVAYPDGKCNDLHKSILFFGKNDLNQTAPNAAGSTGQTNGTNHTGGFYAFRLRLRTFN